MNIETNSRDFDLIRFALAMARNDALARAEKLRGHKRKDTFAIDAAELRAAELGAVLDRMNSEAGRAL